MCLHQELKSDLLQLTINLVVKPHSYIVFIRQGRLENSGATMQNICEWLNSGSLSFFSFRGTHRLFAKCAEGFLAHARPLKHLSS